MVCLFSILIGKYRLCDSLFVYMYLIRMIIKFQKWKNRKYNILMIHRARRVFLWPNVSFLLQWRESKRIAHHIFCVDRYILISRSQAYATNTNVVLISIRWNLWSPNANFRRKNRKTDLNLYFGKLKIHVIKFQSIIY